MTQKLHSSVTHAEFSPQPQKSKKFKKIFWAITFMTICSTHITVLMREKKKAVIKAVFKITHLSQDLMFKTGLNIFIFLKR